MDLTHFQKSELLKRWERNPIQALGLNEIQTDLLNWLVDAPDGYGEWAEVDTRRG